MENLESNKELNSANLMEGFIQIFYGQESCHNTHITRFRQRSASTHYPLSFYQKINYKFAEHIFPPMKMLSFSNKSALFIKFQVMCVWRLLRNCRVMLGAKYTTIGRPRGPRPAAASLSSTLKYLSRLGQARAEIKR